MGENAMVALTVVGTIGLVALTFSAGFAWGAYSEICRWRKPGE